jgi:hypothetical protein
VLVVVVAVGGVPVPAMGVVDVITMANGLMTTAGPVLVLMPGVRQVRQRVLVVVALVGGVGMTFVNVVGVALALHAGVAATGPVLMRVGVVHLMSGGHGSSLLC